MQINFTNKSFVNQPQNVQNFQFRPNAPPQPVFLTPQKSPQNVEYLPHNPHEQSEKIMYKSTIQLFNPPNNQPQQVPSFGLGKLASMGREIQQAQDQSNKFQEKTAVIQHQQPKPFAFRSERPEKPKMASSMIFFNNKGYDQNANFPSLNHEPVHQNEAPKGIQSLMSKAKIVHQEIQTSQSPQDKRTRQILEIKQQMDQLSNRIEGFRPKNTPAFVPSQPQEVVPLTFVKNRSQSVSSSAQTSAEFNFKKSYSEQPDYNKGTFQKQPFQSVQIPTTPNKVSQSKYNNVNPPNDAFSKKPTQPLSSNPTIESQSKEQNGMFKKKSAYVAQQSQQTNQNLLKILGINIKTSYSKQFAVSPNKSTELKPESVANSKKAQPLSTPNKVLQPPIAKNAQTPQIRKCVTKNDFKIGKKMGKGQFGEVMLVQHKLTGFICGMKVMSKKQIKSQKYQNQIARELSIQFFLSHRHIAPLYGFFQDEQNLYLLVEFCTDGQLLEMIRKNRRMQENEVSPIIREICEGLDYIHMEEIIHRDIKPQNILFNFGTVKISDFGWAVHCGNGMRKTVSGSPLYYSPEIVLETQYDEKIDIWAVGMMAYQCLLGKIPFRIYSQFDLNRIVQDQIKFPQYVDVTEEAKDFILRIMKKKPEERMEIKQIMRHPFITKYLKQRKVTPQILDQFRKALCL